MERCPSTMALIRLGGTWISCARRFMLRPRSSSVSLRIPPGCTGGSLGFKRGPLPVVFGDFDVMGILLFPGETDPVLIVDTEAVPALPLSLQRFQPVAGRDQQIGEGLGTVESGQSAQGYGRDALEFLDPLPIP